LDLGQLRLDIFQVFAGDAGLFFFFFLQQFDEFGALAGH
jgi:hypothetical protein